MQTLRRRLCLALVAGIATPLFAAPSSPATEIELLIARVEQARGVVFIRNGREYSADEAATHLRRKLKAARGRIRTPEQFIEHLGTRSSVTGKPYRVRLPDGRSLDSAAWLRQLLRDVRAQR
ncbi:DUF5329 domain-containing protein [Lysobacter sp. CFH 32150]|uniref:DUF5329 family protein n=1 Tax=Lysobacter sp. CFH 32150 TaxID=2927128 RepID=UPI001FA7E41E|nr:DUF5329 domain-containing protein [Lysobacter sp. CFH 32150]MCI4567595.1 DUF5329 domain-containing protein [Lysobacter sp. CFH 32150]